MLGIDKKNYRQNDNKFRYFNRLAPWRVLGIDKRNDQKRQRPQAKPVDVLISAAKHGGGERNYFINGILLRTNA